MIDPTAVINDKATVDSSITVGARTKIYQYATVIQGTVLGDDCNVGAGAVITGAIFGNGCRIGSNAVMGPGFKIGNNVFIGPGVVLANDLYPSVDKEFYDDEALRSGEKFAVIIEDDAIIGANSVILPGVRIGKGAIVSATALCNTNVPPNRIYRVDRTITKNEGYDLEKRMRWATPREFPQA